MFLLGCMEAVSRCHLDYPELKLFLRRTGYSAPVVLMMHDQFKEITG